MTVTPASGNVNKTSKFKTKNRRGTVKTAGLENARLENAAPNCRTGKCGNRHVWKAKLRTSHRVVFSLV